MGPQLKVLSVRLVKPEIKPVTPGLQGKGFIHFTTAAPDTTTNLEFIEDFRVFSSTCVKMNSEKSSIALRMFECKYFVNNATVVC